MIITAVQIRRMENTGTKLRGIVSITLDNMIVIHDIKILQNGEDMFLAMPSRSIKSNTFKDIVHPINSDVRQVFERIVFDAYKESEKILCSYLEFLLREENTDITFDDLKISDYIVGRVTSQAQVSQSSNNFATASKQVQRKKEPESEIDANLLKWLEG